jgi:hypothetical protein
MTWKFSSLFSGIMVLYGILLATALCLPYYISFIALVLITLPGSMAVNYVLDLDMEGDMPREAWLLYICSGLLNMGVLYGLYRISRNYEKH